MLRPDAHRGKHRLLVLFVLAMAAASYIGNMDVYFIKDDLSMGMFTDDQGGFRWQGFKEQLLWPTERSWDHIWRPIPALHWAADFLVFGADPIAFHLGNLFWHMFVCVLLYWFINRITGFRNPLAGFFAGIFFAVYPLNPEAVLWLTQRTVLSGLAFSLASLIAFHVWMQQRTRLSFALTWILLILAILCREHALTLPGVFGVMYLLSGPEATLIQRFKRFVPAIVVSLVIFTAYFGCRWLIWGQFTGPYSGYPSNHAYAVANNVYARIPESLKICLVPGNAELMTDEPLTGLFSWKQPVSWLDIFTGFQIFVGTIGLWNLTRPGESHRERLSFLAIIITFTLTSWLVVWQVFFVNPNLLNSRSGYHIFALMVAGLATAIINPWQPAKNPRLGLLRLVLPAVVAIVWGLVLQLNLGSWSAGGHQVRQIQEEVMAVAQARGHNTVIAVLDTPHEYRGCPTIDENLDALVRPPYVKRAAIAVPFIAGRSYDWPHRVLDPKKRLLSKSVAAGRQVEWFRASVEPPVLRPLFGSREVAAGDEPCRLVYPVDHATLVIGPSNQTLFPAHQGLPKPLSAVPSLAKLSRSELRDPNTWKRADADALPESLTPIISSDDLIFIWEASESQAEFILHLVVPDRTITRRVKVGVNARREGSRVIYGLSRGTTEANGDLLPWPLPKGTIPGVLPVQWRIEVPGPHPQSSVSASRRLLVFDARKN